MEQRQTLARAAETEGIGLHSGKRVKMQLLPGEPQSGIVFVRSDLGNLSIPARLEYAGPSFYATVLQRDGATVSTIEHLLAAVYAMQIDDLRIVLDGPEVPIMDGSSRPFVDMILEAGRVPLPVARQYVTLIRPVQISHEDKRIAAYPSREYRVTYAIDFEHPLLGYQELSASLWEEQAFVEKVAPARTFTLERDIDLLRRKGLARGGSLDNAVVLGTDGILNSELRFPDEFVRHKMLDLTGDLSLLGHPLRAHVVAYRAGHDLHARLARRIWKSGDSWYLAPWVRKPTGVDAAADG